MQDGWTAAQAAFVLNERLDIFKKMVERGPVKPFIAHRSGRRTRQFALVDLVFLHAERELKAELTPRGRAELYEALTTLPPHDRHSEVSFGPLKFEFGRHLREVQSQLKRLNKLADAIDTSGREPLLKDTQIEVYRIAALLDGGMTVDAIRQDYPSLTTQQIVAAKAYAEINPKARRPYPKITAKAAMRGSGLDVLDTPE